MDYNGSVQWRVVTMEHNGRVQWRVVTMEYNRKDHTMVECSGE